MRRSQRRAWSLAIAVVVLAALAWWQWHGARARATLLSLRPASITRIVVTRQGHAGRRYVKRNGRWYHAGKPADDAHLQRLASLAATPVLSWRKASTMQAGKVGLATPPVTVRLNGHALAYGTLAAFGPQRFVRVGDKIAVIPASYSPRAPERVAPSASASAPASSQKS